MVTDFLPPSMKEPGNNMTVTEESEQAKQLSGSDTPKEGTESLPEKEEGDREPSVSFADIEKRRRAIGLDDDDDDDDEVENEIFRNSGFCYRCVARMPPCRRCLAKWPRCCALWLGVIIPLWILIALSLFFGYFLSKVEAPNEVVSNNARMEAERAAEAVNTIVGNFTAILPRLCFEIYIFENKTLDGLEEWITDLLLGDAELVPPGIREDLVIINRTELYWFMDECGKAAEPFANNLFVEGVNRAVEASEGLAFNWIRCPSDSGFFQRPDNMTEIRPEAQEQFFRDAWDADQQRLVAEYYAENLAANMNNTIAILDAFGRSIEDADGSGDCGWNVPAAAWWWFILMTTVGYGNDTPSTTAGRTMVYTLGFASVIAFAAILTSAGFVTNAIVDDMVYRFRMMRRLRIAWVACLVWGMIYYSWMLIIAAVTQQWKLVRLGESESFRDMYWFAFISTTTIGLGDIYLEPEVTLGVDLIYYPLLFLAGFTFLSAFFQKLGEAVGSMGTGKSFAESLLTPLKSMDMLEEDDSEIEAEPDVKDSNSEEPADNMERVDEESKDTPPEDARKETNEADAEPVTPTN